MNKATLARGDVVLTTFLFTDLTGSSLRSAVIVSSGSIAQDVILVAISSVVRGAASPYDYTIEESHPEFELTGLRVTSVLRTHKLAAVELDVLVRRLGRLGPELQNELANRLRTILGL
jgi:mRNA interferase MazF